LQGGIAHDFNNLLTAILGNITLAKVSSSSEEKAYKRLTEAEKSLERAKGLTQQLLTFSRGGVPVRKTSYIRNLIKDSASFPLVGSNVRCEYSIQKDLSPVDVDIGQISQVMNNIILNARDAMPEGGVIKIGAKNIRVEKGKGDTKAGSLKEGQYIRISVQDRGVGIDKNNLNKIFDPYFTTKSEGSGLGLATTYSIIKNHDGLITVESKVGIGTTFYIYLPASDKEVQRDKDSEEIIATLKEEKYKGTKVLVMDDEENIRGFVGDVLGTMGCEVSCAKDGSEAIELYKGAKESKKTFDIVIMDLTIPGGMGGREAIGELKRIDPDVKAIVSSGYSNDPVMSDYKRYGFKGVLKKPFMITELTRVMDEVIKGGK
jgi:CheY-like chemotaxis protein